MFKKCISLLLALVFLIGVPFSGVASASEYSVNSTVESGNLEDYIFESTENEEMLTGIVKDAEGNTVNTIEINKQTDEIIVDGDKLSDQDQNDIQEFVAIYNGDINEYNAALEAEEPSFGIMSANACSYKGIGTYKGSLTVPKIGVAAFAGVISLYTKSPYNAAWQTASIVVGSVPTAYYTLTDSQCTKNKVIHNKRIIKFYTDSARKKKIGPTSTIYNKGSQGFGSK